MTDEPQRVTSDDITGLREETGRLADSVEHLAAKQTASDVRIDSNETQIATNQRLARRANWNSFGAVAAVVLVLLLGGFWWNSQRIQHDRDDAAKSAARLSVCVHDNADATKQQMLWHGLLSLPGAKQPDPTVLAAFNRLLDSTFPQRDCSPAAIDAYYSHGGK